MLPAFRSGVTNSGSLNTDVPPVAVVYQLYVTSVVVEVTRSAAVPPVQVLTLFDSSVGTGGTVVISTPHTLLSAALPQLPLLAST